MSFAYLINWQRTISGRDVKLANGNVASRILPIKIHDLDNEDNVILESELGGVLRAVDFIYRSPGVNRPLAITDNPDKNQNKTFYRDQVNKVANAVKEIVTALKKPSQNVRATGTKQTVTQHRQNKRLQSISLVILIIVIAGYFLHQQWTTNNEQPTLGKSIAVLPFVNLSNDAEQEYFSDGITEDIINLLAKLPNIKVIGPASAFYFKGRNEDSKVIGEKLGVGQLLQGSVRKEGNKIRVITYLINAQDGALLWSETYNRELEGILELQDDISKSLVNALQIKWLGKTGSDSSVVNPAAYAAYLQGRFYYEKNPSQTKTEDTNRAISYFKKSIELDSSFVLPLAYLTFSYLRVATTNRSAEFLEAKRCSNRALRLDGNSTRALIAAGDIAQSEYNLKLAKLYTDKALSKEPRDPFVLRNACGTYMFLNQPDKAIEYGKKSLLLDPFNFVAQYSLFQAYRNSGRYAESLKLFSQFQELGNPSFTNENRKYYEGLLLIDKGKAKEVIETFDDTHLEVKARAYLKLGLNDKAKELINKINDGHPPYGHQIALLYSSGQNSEEVRKWLEYSYAHGEFGFVYIVSNARNQQYWRESWFKELEKKVLMP
jgi:adenylate cyclase